MVTESVDIMKQYRVYPHERFALRRLVAGTLSASSSSSGFSVGGFIVRGLPLSDGLCCEDDCRYGRSR